MRPASSPAAAVRPIRKSRRPGSAADAATAVGAAKRTVKSVIAGSPARIWRPKASPAAIAAPSRRSSVSARAVSSAAATHQGSQAAAGPAFAKAEPYESIIPEKANATPLKNAPPSDRPSRVARARAPKNAQSTCSR